MQLAPRQLQSKSPDTSLIDPGAETGLHIPSPIAQHVGKKYLVVQLAQPAPRRQVSLTGPRRAWHR